MKGLAIVKGLFCLSILSVLTSCGAVRQMSQSNIDRADSIDSKIAKARNMEAITCAPEDLAKAETHLVLARHEAQEFHDQREMDEYFQKAEIAADELISKTTPCWQAMLRERADEDADGVADYLDRCPKTPKKAEIDARGCPLDADNDKVADYMDDCPATPEDIQVDGKGCPTDQDGDEVADYLDRCPSTPNGVSVDAIGCPLDSDGDEVADYLDACPNTPSGVSVDSKGCAPDSDGDNIANYLDKCANTPKGAVVDASGCPIDTDGDLLSDWDETNKYKTDPNNADTDGDTLSDGAEIFTHNTNPLLADSDGGGVNDGLEIAYAKTNPLDAADDVKEVSRTELSIQFDVNSDKIKPEYKDDIAKIADFLQQYPEVTIQVEGHTDAVGDEDYNLFLSQKRADSVIDTLISNYGIEPTRLKAVGYGEAMPLAPNETKEGRALNRRIYAVGTTK